MDDVSSERGEEPVSADQPNDFADDLDQLAIVEAELARAEAELDALEDHGSDQDSSPAP